MTESELLTRAACREIFERAEAPARAAGAEVEVSLGAGSFAVTRFASNTIHQNVAEERRYASIRVLQDQRTARVSTNRFDEASIRAAVGQALEIARALPPDEELLPMAAPAAIDELERFAPATAAATPHDRAATVAEAIRIVESARATAAGIYSTGQSVEAILNSRGVCGYYVETGAQFSITAMGADASGWAKASAPDIAAFDPLALARAASRKAALGAGPRELPPGRYTVILEPAAVCDLLGQMWFDFSATAVRDQRSFLTGRAGEKLFGDGISIADDVRHPLQSGAPFDGEGVPRRRLTLVENGVVRELARSRQAARRDGAGPTGHGFPLPNEEGEAPVNIVIAGGDRPLADIVASTASAILVTRFWYIREVDPYRKIMTGMTRDGTFLVEDGRVVCGVKNFRFNQSLIDLLNRVEAMSPAERVSGEEAFDTVAPAMRAADFNFTEVTQA
jgi:predicted Zn-dependent protease